MNSKARIGPLFGLSRTWRPIDSIILFLLRCLLIVLLYSFFGCRAFLPSFTPCTGSKKGWFWKDGRQRCGTWAQLHNYDMIFERMLFLHAVGGCSCRSGRARQQKIATVEVLRDVHWAREMVQQPQVHFFFRMTPFWWAKEAKKKVWDDFCFVLCYSHSPLFFSAVNRGRHDLTITLVLFVFSRPRSICHIPRDFLS